MGKKPRILVIDDEVLVTEALKEIILSQYDMDILTCNDPCEAIPLLKKNQPIFNFQKNKIDCVICDIKMPGINGLDLIKSWRQMEGKNNIPVVILSAYEDPSKWYEITHPQNIFASAYLKKPIKKQEVLDVVNDIVYEDKNNELMERTRKSSYDKVGMLQNEKELKRARDIQMSVIPEIMPTIEGLDIKSTFNSAKFIGGDFFDFIHQKNRLGIILIDIIGKGIPASLMMVRIREILHQHIDLTISPKEFVSRFNKILFEDSSIKTAVPIFYALIDIPTMQFTYVNTLGNAGGILCSNGVSEILDTGGFMAGASQEEEYLEGVINLRMGDTITLFTDGITEQENREGKQLGLEGLSQMIVKASLRKEIFHESLSEYFDQFKGSAIQSDDLTMINISVTK